MTVLISKVQKRGCQTLKLHKQKTGPFFEPLTSDQEPQFDEFAIQQLTVYPDKLFLGTLQTKR